MEADPSYQTRGGATALSSGVGFTLVWDSRDVPINAYRGWYLAADWVAYVPSPLGNSTWMAAGLDYRHAVTLGREGSTLTWQVRYRTAWGAVPWSDLPLVGTPFDLRAYRLGRFRDATSLVALVEYRWMMPFEPKPWWKLWTRLGFALWTGVGALGSTPLPDFSAVLPAAGVGLRVLIQDRVTLRLDFGVGRGSTAFYFQFLEAF
jgi:outer membrane protein assembly factor BamA